MRAKADNLMLPRRAPGDRKLDRDVALFTQMTLSPEFEDFLTLQGYRYL